MPAAAAHKGDTSYALQIWGSRGNISTSCRPVGARRRHYLTERDAETVMEHSAQGDVEARAESGNALRDVVGV